MNNNSVKVLACIPEEVKNNERYYNFKNIIQLLPWITYCKECGAVILFTREAKIEIRIIDRGSANIPRYHSKYILQCPVCKEKSITTEINIGSVYECTGLQCKCKRYINGRHITRCDKCNTYSWDYRRYHIDDYFSIDMKKLEKEVNKLINWVREPHTNGITTYPFSLDELYHKIQDINDGSHLYVDSLKNRIDAFINKLSKDREDEIPSKYLKSIDNDSKDEGNDESSNIKLTNTKENQSVCSYKYYIDYDLTGESKVIIYDDKEEKIIAELKMDDVMYIAHLADFMKKFKNS